MNKLHNDENGFMSIMLMVIAALLLIMIGMSFEVTKALHRRNRKEKARIQKRADAIRIIQKNPDRHRQTRTNTD
jgi:Flp pilus assembly protein TadG